MCDFTNDEIEKMANNIADHGDWGNFAKHPNAKPSEKIHGKHEKIHDKELEDVYQ